MRASEAVSAASGKHPIGLAGGAIRKMRNDKNEPNDYVTPPGRIGGLRHVGIIMDGNGRWAAARGLPRVEGHRRGVEALRRTIRIASEYGIEFLTIYAFSAENWRRPAQEVSYLMGLLRRFIRNDLADLHASQVRVRVIGSRENVPPDIVSLIAEAEEMTRANTKMTLSVAFNYGGRQEIADAARLLAEQVQRGEISPADIDVNAIARQLYAPDIPDPDLILRTSGEQRLSNFMMWQAAYAEFVFLPEHWPDFDRAAFDSALAQYAARERRFGGLADNSRDGRKALTGS